MIIVILKYIIIVITLYDIIKCNQKHTFHVQMLFNHDQELFIFMSEFIEWLYMHELQYDTYPSITM